MVRKNGLKTITPGAEGMKNEYIPELYRKYRYVSAMDEGIIIMITIKVAEEFT